MLQILEYELLSSSLQHPVDGNFGLTNETTKLALVAKGLTSSCRWMPLYSCPYKV
jgi:hypothetical protein